MARGSFVHEKTVEPMLDPALLLWTGVVLQALADAGGVPGLNRLQARIFLRGQTSFSIHTGRRIRCLDMILAALGIDIEVYYSLHLSALEQQWAACEPHMAEVAEARRARLLQQRAQRASRAVVRKGLPLCTTGQPEQG